MARPILGSAEACSVSVCARVRACVRACASACVRVCTPHGASEDDSLAQQTLVACQIGCRLDHRIGAVRDNDFVLKHFAAQVGEFAPVLLSEFGAVLHVPTRNHYNISKGS
jgi:hypothetical protein